MVFVNAVAFLIGLVLLIKGSEYFVEAASAIAKRLGVSEFMIGLTLVALGTSIPELASAIAATLAGSSGIIIGSIVGSNISNIGLIVGVTATIAAVATTKQMLMRDGYIMLFSALIFFVFAVDGLIQLWEAGLFIVLYIAYIIFVLEAPKRKADEEHLGKFIVYFLRFKYLAVLGEKSAQALKQTTGAERIKQRKQLVVDFIVVALGGIATAIGAHWVVREALVFAGALGVADTFIGVTIIGIGTSLPELSVTLSAARRGLGNIAIGNVLGSNIANILLIIGVSGLIGTLVVSQTMLLFTMPFMIFMSILLLIFIRSNWELHRIEGIVFFILFALFLIVLGIFPSLVA